MSNLPVQDPHWPFHLQELCGRLQAGSGGSGREVARGEVWLLLNTVLLRQLTFHSARLGRVPREDLEDIAAQKSLDLLRKAEQGQWNLAGRVPGEIAAFLAKVARNGLLDHLRRSVRLVQPAQQERSAWDVADRGRERTVSPAAQPQQRVERREFAEALGRCARELHPRSRRIWFFRVFLEMPSKEIAIHPEIELKPSHVDVLLQRTREAIRDCMIRKGFQPHEMPPGVLGELWKILRADGTWSERDGLPGPDGAAR